MEIKFLPKFRYCVYFSPMIYGTQVKRERNILIRTISYDLGFQNFNFLDWTVPRAGFGLANLVNHIHPFDNPAKGRVLPIEEVVVDEVDKELGPAGIGARVSHGDGPAIVPVNA
jgi:hypothetical protein